MELWGANLYGNPCRDCGYDWSVTSRQAVRQIAGMPVRFGAVLEGRTGRESHPELSWTAAAYVCHVADNLRNWSERLTGARLTGETAVPGYDPDLLARARGYDRMSAASALWSLEVASDAWCLALEHALEAGVVLEHATRGVQRAEDVARNNAHDATHHLWDVRRILAHTAAPAPRLPEENRR
jgi:hypothetical protein